MHGGCRVGHVYNLKRIPVFTSHIRIIAGNVHIRCLEQPCTAGVAHDAPFVLRSGRICDVNNFKCIVVVAGNIGEVTGETSTPFG